MITKRCDVCGKVFESEYDGKFVFCTDECTKKGKRIFSTITKKCKNCGREFEIDRKNTNYCCDECKEAAVKEYQKKYRQSHFEPAKPVTKVCEFCGREFEGHGNSKYCCDECRREAANLRERNNYKPAKPVTKVCKICGREFKAKGKTIYCSDECREKGHKESRRIYRKSNKGQKVIKKAKKKYKQSDKGKKANKKYIQKTIAELNEKYDGDLNLILKDCPNMWMIREAVMQVEYGVSYVEAMNQKVKLNPVCEVTGESGDLVIHHLDSFNIHPEKGADLDNLVRVKREIHDEFHNIYGRGNNTREQWFEFVANMDSILQPNVTKIKCILD